MRTTIHEAIAVFLQDKESQNWTPKVVQRYRLDLNRLARFCNQAGIKHLQDVKLPILSAYRATWKSIYPASRTQRKTQTRIRSFFRYAVAADWIDRNYAEGLSTIKDRSKPTMPLEPEEYEVLVKAITPALFPELETLQRMQALILLQRHTGLAIADAVKLDREDVQYHEKKKFYRVVTSRAKTQVAVYVPVKEEVATAVINLPKGALFPGSLSQWHRRYRTAFDAAGLPEGHSHQLRDTFAVESLKAGIPLEDVSRLLGHSSISTTEKHYAPWVPSRQDRLDFIVRGSWGTGI
jgi:site-specific recombinase XerD